MIILEILWNELGRYMNILNVCHDNKYRTIIELLWEFKG
jgi:hypothetical protein